MGQDTKRAAREKEPLQKQERYRAFTIKSKGRLSNLHLEIGIVEHSPVEKQAVATINKYRGMIDTASAFSRVSPQVVDELGITLEDKEGTLCAQLDFYLPNTIRVTGVLARVEAIEPEECHCMLGMDVLSCGDLTLSHQSGETQFSFRVPSLGAEDFVQSHRKRYKSKTVIAAATRNQPCPCGSGKKYKNCCGKID